ncbi:MAG: hypothetical protein H5T83_02335 [Actinotalea sp.]|nr:hypothetical protein [Actinotalea sp.]
MADDTRGPAGPPADGAAGADDGTTGGAPGRHGRSSPGRGRLWAALAVVLVVVAVVVAVLLLVNRPDRAPVAEPPAEPETVTLPVPTPTVEPVALPEGASAFLQAMPTEVLAFALTEVAEDPGDLTQGALESYRLAYDDGERQIVATAGQWRDPEGVTRRFEEVVAAQEEAVGVPAEEAGAPDDGGPTDDGATDDAATDDAATEGDGGDGSDGATQGPDTPRLETGSVEVDGEQVGRFLQLTGTDGTGTLWWTNGTVLLRLEGPGEALRDVYAAFPL